MSECVCSVWTPDDNSLRFCAEHHAYYRGAGRLSSVTGVLRTVIPVDYSAVDPAVLENARERGIQVDDLASRYVVGGLDRIPAGTRRDAVELFFRFREWWDNHKHGEIRSQVMLCDTDIAGTADIIDGETIYDVKATYSVDPIYELQLAAYAELHEIMYQRPVKHVAVIHLTKRKPKAHIHKIDLPQASQDWQAIRAAYRVIKRRANQERNEQIPQH